MLERLRDVVLFVAGIIAVGALILAAYEGFNQRVASATFLGALGVVCTFMLFMPKLEVFKVWGMEARLVRTLDRAEEIIGKLRRLSLISARTGYMQLAWGNRMASPSAKEKQSVLDEIDAQLAELQVSPSERDAITRQFVQIIAFDFLQIFARAIQQYGAILFQNLQDKASASNSEEDREAVRLHSEKKTAWHNRTTDPDVFSRLETLDLGKEIDREMPVEWLDEPARIQAELFKTELLALLKACQQKGGFTREAAEYYDNYSARNNDKAKLVFGPIVGGPK